VFWLDVFYVREIYTRLLEGKLTILILKLLLLDLILFLLFFNTRGFITLNLEEISFIVASTVTIFVLQNNFRFISSFIFPVAAYRKTILFVMFSLTLFFQNFGSALIIHLIWGVNILIVLNKDFWEFIQDNTIEPIKWALVRSLSLDYERQTNRKTPTRRTFFFIFLFLYTCKVCPFFQLIGFFFFNSVCDAWVMCTLYPAVLFGMTADCFNSTGWIFWCLWDDLLVVFECINNNATLNCFFSYLSSLRIYKVFENMVWYHTTRCINYYSLFIISLFLFIFFLIESLKLFFFFKKKIIQISRNNLTSQHINALSDSVSKYSVTYSTRVNTNNR